MIILKEVSGSSTDGSPRLNYFQLDTSGMFYAIYGDDEYAIPILGWGIDGENTCYITPLVLKSKFGLIPVWAVTCNDKNFKGVITRSEM